jgi:hypothetical protein
VGTRCRGGRGVSEDSVLSGEDKTKGLCADRYQGCFGLVRAGRNRSHCAVGAQCQQGAVWWGQGGQPVAPTAQGGQQVPRSYCLMQLSQ